MSKRKNICVVINALAMGGAEKQSVLLTKALNPFHNVTMVILSPRRLYKPRLNELQQEKITYRFLSKNTLKNFFLLTYFFREQRTDVVFSFLATDTVLSGICGRMAKVPFVFGGIRNSNIPKWKLTILRIIHNKWLNYTIANNYSGCKAAIDFGYLPKLFVIPNGITIRKLRKNVRTTSQIRIISLGRLVNQKRYDIAIQTIAHLKKTTNLEGKLKYHIVGKGPELDIINNLIQKYGVDHEIDVITNTPDVYALLEKSNIYLCTSSFEGISNSLLEAMNCALPIVATDVGDNSRLVLHNKNGFLCRESDVVDLAEKLKDLIKNPQMRNRMGSESYAHLKENFSFETFQNKYLELIANLNNISISDHEFTVNQ